MSDSNQLSKAPLNLLVNPKTARKGKPWEKHKMQDISKMN